MKYLSVFLLFLIRISFAQISPDWTYTLIDTLTSISIFDFHVDKDETIYTTGQKIIGNENNLFVTAISKNSDRLFEVTIGGPVGFFGQFIIPSDTSHFVICGSSEDSTGTFNIRTVKLTKSGNVLWDKTFGKDGLFIMDEATDVEIDSQGNIIITGSSSSVEQQYTLVQYSPSGNLNWSVRHKPFDFGQFEIKDIIIDSEDNIYGISRNIFIEDTLHGTIFKRDENGILLWEKSFDVFFSDEASDHLVLKNDTLYVAGSLFTEGSSSNKIVCLSLTKDGDVISHRRITVPGNAIQQNVRHLKSISNDRFVLANESYLNGDYFLNVLVLSKNFNVLYSDSITSRSPIKAIIVSKFDQEFFIYNYGGELNKTDYSIAQSGNIDKSMKSFDTEGQLVDKIFFNESNIYTSTLAIGFPVTSTILKRYNQVTTGVTTQPNIIPITPKLYPAYPNPFNPVTKIKYIIPASLNPSQGGTLISLKVYDVLGNEITTIVNEEQPAGEYEVEFSAKGGGSSLPSGIYFYALQAGSFTESKKLILLK